jgi:hypothetical protein
VRSFSRASRWTTTGAKRCTAAGDGAGGEFRYERSECKAYEHDYFRLPITQLLRVLDALPPTGPPAPSHWPLPSAAASPSACSPQRRTLSQYKEHCPGLQVLFSANVKHKRTRG